MNSKLLTAAALLLLLSSCHLERHDITFEQSIEQDSTNTVHAVALAHEGGYIIVGARDWDLFGTHGFWCKTDLQGKTLERRDYGFGHPINNENTIYKVIPLNNTGYGICGYRVENNKKLIYWALLDDQGHEIGPGANIGLEGEGNDLAITPEEDFIIAGHKKLNATDISACIVKVRQDGSVLWTNSSLGEGALYGAFAHPDGYYAAIFSDVNAVPVLYKLDPADGSVLDSIHLDFLPGINPPSTFRLTSDGGFILSSVLTTSVFARSIIVKLDRSGTKEWLKQIEDIKVASVRELDGGDYIICATTKDPSFVQKSDVYLAKLDSDGETILWTRKYGGSLTETASDVIPTPDGGFFIGGTDESISTGDMQPGNIGVYIIKTNSDGLVL